MCNVALAAQGVGAGFSAIGAYSGARSQQSALNYEAGVAGFNATQAENQAQIALEQGQFQVNQLRRAAAADKGSARQAFAASGVDLTTGSPVDVLTSMDAMSEMDVNQAEINAVREAWGYRAQRVNFESEARAKRAGAKGINPWMASATSLIGSAASISSSYASLSKAGGVGSQKAAAQSRKWGAGG